MPFWRSHPELQPREPAPEPPRDWLGTMHALVTAGFEDRECPALCRRKGGHRHMANPSADLIVSPAAVERGGA